MLSAYINYPNPHITLHFDPTCALIRSHESPGQRILQINVDTVTDVLKNFVDREVRFAAERGLNDMWLFVTFDDRDFEKATVLYIQQLIGRQYRPLATAPVKVHCE
jgi:hypothetical protein